MEKLPFVDALTLGCGLLPDHLDVLDGADAALVLGKVPRCQYLVPCIYSKMNIWNT